MKRVLFLVFSIISFTCQAQREPAIDRVVQSLASELRENYILEPQANLMAGKLESNLRNGSYDDLLPEDLASRLQIDVRSIFNDKHLRIGTRNQRRSSYGTGESVNYPNGLGEVQFYDNNIAYIPISHFPSVTSGYKKALASKIDSIQGSKALIIDMRNNRGGSPDAVQLLCSYFLPANIHLNSLYFRNRDSRRDFYTLDQLDERLLDLPIYLLTSNRTFSAGEEFSYNLKHLNRATLIGETTGGGAHPVNRYNLPDDFYVIIPVGMAINPITGKNWEGVGVIPDIPTKEDEALNRALIEIRNN